MTQINLLQFLRRQRRGARREAEHILPSFRASVRKVHPNHDAVRFEKHKSPRQVLVPQKLPVPTN